jgi:hypothetical protein
MTHPVKLTYLSPTAWSRRCNDSQSNSYCALNLLHIFPHSCLIFWTEVIHSPHYIYRYESSFFTAKIVGYRISTNQDGWFCTPQEFAEYEIECSSGDSTWTVFHRMSEFFGLWGHVEKYIDFTSEYPEPPTPPKKTFGSDISEPFLENRKNELSIFLESILVQYNSFDNVIARQEVERFLLLVHV